MLTCTFEDANKASLRHAIVHALVIKGSKILLVRRAEKLIEGGKWGFPGGFVDRDETLEEAVKREVKEEAGWDIEVTSLISIIDNPNRPRDADRQNIAFNYLCKAIEKTGESDWEVTEQKWFDLHSLPREKEIAFDHYQVIQNYLQHPEARPEITMLSA
ncbi:MAG: NUDIX hydrolase [Patescibacteria group bacterium]